MSKKHKNVILNTDIKYYMIEEYQSRWCRWAPLSKYYLDGHEFNTESDNNRYVSYTLEDKGIIGTVDEEAAVEYLDALRYALSSGELADDKVINDNRVTEFRLVKVKHREKAEVIL